MQEEINVKKAQSTLENRIRREVFWIKLKSFPVIGQFVSLPKCSKGENESNSEEIKLWTLSLQLASAIITKNEEEQDEMKKEILNNNIMKEPRSKEYYEYLLTLEYSKKESVDKILNYVQIILNA